MAAISSGTGAGKGAAIASRRLLVSAGEASVSPAGASSVPNQYTSPWPMAPKPKRRPGPHTSHPTPSKPSGSRNGVTAR